MITNTPHAPKVKPDYWAIHSATGIHIGLWTDKADADEALREYEGGTITPLYRHAAPAPHLRGDEAEWIKTCTAKISNAIGGGSELFSRHGDEFRLDIDFACKRISEQRERMISAFANARRAQRNAGLEAAATSHINAATKIRDNPKNYLDGELRKHAKRSIGYHERAALAIRAMKEAER